MKTLSLRSCCAVLALLVTSCAGWAGNGFSVSATWEDPESGVKIEAGTAK